MLFVQLGPNLCDPMDYSPQVSSVHGILQAEILDWVAANKRENTHTSPPKKILGSSIDLKTGTWWLLGSDLTCKFRILKL